MDEGWTPPSPWGDPVVWTSRDGNILADAVVNAAMDRGHDVKHVFPLPRSVLGQRACNFVFHSDGGTRAERCSGAGWTMDASVTATDGVANTHRVAAAATYLAQPTSSFKAECIALDLATEAFQRFLHTTRRRSDGTFASSD